MSEKKFFKLTINHWWDWEAPEFDEKYFHGRENAVTHVKGLEPKDREKDVVDSFVMGDKYCGKKTEEKEGVFWTEYIIEELKFED